MRTSVKLLMFLGIFAIALLAMMVLTSNAEARTATWDGGGANALASTKENWDTDVAPIAGDTIVFNTGSAACTWDAAITTAGFYENATYSGVITIGANFGSSIVSLAAGTLTGSTSYTWTISDNFTQASGNTMTTAVLQLSMSGTGKVLDVASANTFNKLTVTGTISLSTSLYVNNIANSGTLTIASSKVITVKLYVGTETITNSGTITGPGKMLLYVHGSDFTCSLGTMTSIVEILLKSNAATSRVMTLGASCTLGALTIDSEHASYTMTLAVNGKTLTASSVEVSTRGILNGAGSIVSGSIISTVNGVFAPGTGAIIKCSSLWATQLGTWTPGTSSVNMTGDSTLNIGAAQSFYDLTIYSGTRTLLSTLQVTNCLNVKGILAESIYSTSIAGTTTNPARLNGTWSGIVNITSSGASYTVYAGNSWTGTLQFSKPITIITPAHRLVITPASAKYCNATMKSTHFWMGSTTAALSVTFAWNGWTAGDEYSVMAGTTRLGNYIVDAGGYVNFTYNSWSAHDMSLDARPEITSTPITSSIIGHQYSYDCNASEAGTWSLTSSYADLDIDIDGIVSGFLSTNGLSPAGDSITVNITFTDSVGGKAYDNYTITVGGVQEDLIPLGVGVISIVIIVGLTTLAIGSVRRKMH